RAKAAAGRYAAYSATAADATATLNAGVAALGEVNSALVRAKQIAVEGANGTVGGQEYDELHVDGGVTRQIYVAPLNVPYRAYDQFYSKPPDRRLFIIQNGRLSAQYEPVQEKTIPIAASSISTLLTSQNKGDLYRIYRMSLDAGVDFNMLAVPEGFEVRKTEAFDLAYQRALFDEGFRVGRSGGPWLKVPPDAPVAAKRAR
ncbi:MAG: hypothetical protein K2Y05_01525, partial [Hyphomicrobiaceae bacterium]|nr:hypothetical protein [Hyphomicrobiaceae bacterium]